MFKGISFNCEINKGVDDAWVEKHEAEIGTLFDEFLMNNLEESIDRFFPKFQVVWTKKSKVD